MKCERCGLENFHGSICTVKAIEYRVDGSIKRVELLSPMDYPTQSSKEEPPEQDYPRLKATK